MSTQWGEWITLDAHSEPTRRTVRGEEVAVMPSPYDVPQAMRAGFDFDGNELVVQFRYIEPDSQVAHQVRQVASIYFGKHSGRLLGFSVLTDSFPRDSDIARAAEQLKIALNNVRPIRPERQENFRLAQRGFEDSRSQVAAALAPLTETCESR